MHRHPYIRAYMAGIMVPTLFILVAMVALTMVPFHRIIIFPLAIVPNLWGLWNVLHRRFARRIPLGIFGAILPLILMPSGYVLTRIMHVDLPPYILHAAPYALPVGVAIYYLVWKHVVGSLNAIAGLD